MIGQRVTIGEQSIRSSLFATVSFLLLVPFVAQAGQATRELKEIKIAYPPSMASVTLMTGIKQKFFEEEGLRPTLLIITSPHYSWFLEFG